MKVTKEQRRIAELEAALYAAELQLERLEDTLASHSMPYTTTST
ncbi:hypothetical protein [Photobacterium damselae]